MLPSQMFRLQIHHKLRYKHTFKSFLQASSQLSTALNMSITTFDLPGFSPPVPVTLPSSPSTSSSPSSSILTKDHLLSFPAFKTWLRTLQNSLSLQNSETHHPFHNESYKLRNIEVQAADFFGEGRKLGFVKLKADISNSSGERLPGSVFLRGGSVGMLIILEPDDMKKSQRDAEPNEHAYVILTVQPRIPVGSLSFAELPAGMLDEENPSAASSSPKDNGNRSNEKVTFSGSAAREITEETGLIVTSDQLVNMTDLALASSHISSSSGSSPASSEQLQQAMYPSPGGSDEYIPLFLHRRSVTRAQLDDWQGRLTGLRDQGEKITVKIVPLKEAWKVGGRDGKLLAALGLYWGLKGEGKV